MSGYYNSMRGGNDKPKKKKPTRTNHPTWKEILSGGLGGKIRDKSKKAMKKQGI